MSDSTFRISSALKNIIGKELITDEFVAVYELVKNSFDAYSKNVTITFQKGQNDTNSKIIIQDDGKGMNNADIKNKWLFVAYSAKKAGTEDGGYREKIKVNRVFAGAKGVGRFSCDRLGSYLYLETIKNEIRAKTETITINWDDFEKDPLKEFINIKVKQETIKRPKYKLTHGCVLEISNLRDVWDRDRILKLKRALVKLVNPNQENDSRNFRIELIANHEKKQDKYEEFDRDKVNGVIKNDVFEQLKIKTTSLKVLISENGKEIISTLEDRGDRIYTLTEKNPYSNLLKNVAVYLFQLNRAAKIQFHRIMGMESVNYGSVFMYKNGFRIYPFGDPGEDILQIDKRKQQGYNRFLGSRDIIGRIEINGDNDELRETTSRDGGLVKTVTYLSLVDFFYDYVLKRLENYAINVIKWGDEKIIEETGEIQPELLPKDVKLQILELITGYIKSENVINIDYDKNFLDIIESKQDKSVEKIIRNISRIGVKSNNLAIVKEAEKIGKAIQEVKIDAEKKEKENIKLKSEKKDVEDKLEQEIRQSLFQKSIIGREKKDILSLQHQIKHTASSISYSLDKLIEAINKEASKSELLNYVNNISLEVRKIFSASQFVTKANFNMDSIKIKDNIVRFINDYVENIFKPIEHYIHEKKPINISIENKSKLSLPARFRPLELTVIIDNLFSNSKKAGAKNVKLTWKDTNDGFITLSFKDDGKGINEKNIDKVFDFTFSTTDGSGIGLYHIKQIIEGMGGLVTLNKRVIKGAEFILKFKK